MIVLATETSTAQGSVALIQDSQVLVLESSMQQRAHSEFVNPAIERVLQKSKLNLENVDVFATSTGPGSFTGIRVAGNIIKSLSYSFSKPMVALDSLALLALPARFQFKNILTIINAYKNMVYFSVYNNGQLLMGPAVVKVVDLDQTLAALEGPILCLGDGYNSYEKTFSTTLKNRLIRDEKFSDYPSASTLGLEAVQLAKLNKTIEWNSFVPLYLRASEAEENLRLK